MTLLHLALKDISRNAFRSWVIFLCALLVAGLALGTLLITRGAQDSLHLALGRLGADIIVVPEGSETEVETALLMGTPADTWMPADKTAEISEVDGVARVSPQIYLASLENAACCSVNNMFMVAFDPATDFTIQPWIEENLGGALSLGEVVGGTFVFVPEGQENIILYNYVLTLRANIEPTGTNLDQSMFLTLETAKDMARMSADRAEEPLVVPEDQVSAVLVQVEEGADPEEVAVQILRDVPGVTPVASPAMFTTFRSQMQAVLSSMVLALALTLGLSLVLIALVFSMATHERRREIGVLRAVGFRKRAIFSLLFWETGWVSLFSSLLGAGTGIAAAYLASPAFGIEHSTIVLPPAIFGAVAGLTLGLLGAIPPARRAAALSPTEAIRSL